MEQVTDKLKENGTMLLGKVKFFNGGSYSVPVPKKSITNKEWLQRHAEYVNGVIVRENGKMWVVK